MNTVPKPKTQTAKQGFSPASKNVLSLDGGGMRALVPAMILAELESHLQRISGNQEARIIECFDLVAGTSAGAILAGLYTLPDPVDPTRPRYSAQQVLQLFEQGGMGAFARPSGKRTEQYCSRYFEERLQSCLGATTPLSALVRPLLVTTFHLDSESPTFLSADQSPDLKVWEAARASSAAPGLFAPAVLPRIGPGSWIDGSVFAVNPALSALAQLGQSLNQTRLVSLGTGRLPKPQEASSNSVMRVLLKNMMSGGSEIVHQQLQQLYQVYPEGKYFRFDPSLPASLAALDLHDEARLQTLKAAAQIWLNHHLAELQHLTHSLTAAPAILAHPSTQ